MGSQKRKLEETQLFCVRIWWLVIVERTNVYSNWKSKEKSERTLLDFNHLWGETWVVSSRDLNFSRGLRGSFAVRKCFSGGNIYLRHEIEIWLPFDGNRFVDRWIGKQKPNFCDLQKKIESKSCCWPDAIISFFTPALHVARKLFSENIF